LAVGDWRLAISFSETNLLFVKRPPTSSQLAPRGQTKQTLNASKSMATIFLMRNVMPKEGVVYQKKKTSATVAYRRRMTKLPVPPWLSHLQVVLFFDYRFGSPPKPDATPCAHVGFGVRRLLN
jgi:hypothetical protein